MRPTLRLTWESRQSEWKEGKGGARVVHHCSVPILRLTWESREGGREGLWFAYTEVDTGEQTK